MQADPAIERKCAAHTGCWNADPRARRDRHSDQAILDSFPSPRLSSHLLGISFIKYGRTAGVRREEQAKHEWRILRHVAQLWLPDENGRGPVEGQGDEVSHIPSFLNFFPP
jgi:hypothetical protein